MPYYAAQNIRWSLEQTPCMIKYPDEKEGKIVVIKRENRASGKEGLKRFIEENGIPIVDGIEITCIGDIIPKSQEGEYFYVKE